MAHLFILLLAIALTSAIAICRDLGNYNVAILNGVVVVWAQAAFSMAAMFKKGRGMLIFFDMSLDR